MNGDMSDIKLKSKNQNNLVITVKGLCLKMTALLGKQVNPWVKWSQ